MPKLKKAVAKKTVTQKVSPAKKMLKPKAVKPKIIKAKTAKKAIKPAKKAPADASLQTLFATGLVKLHDFWRKQCDVLKKTATTIRTQHEKATAKQKAAKQLLATLAKTLKTHPGKAAQHQKALKAFDEATKVANTIKAHVAEAKESLHQAKRSVEKYTSLNKAIKQFEQEWLTTLTVEKPISTPTKKGQPAKKTRAAVESANIAPLRSKVKMIALDLEDLQDDFNAEFSEALTEPVDIDLVASWDEAFDAEDQKA